MLYKDYLQNRRDYQEQGHLLLLERKHACLFYKPGKGKTYPCIDAMRDVDLAKKGNAKVLILSTADAIKNMWKAEIYPQGILPKNTVMMSFNSAIVEKTKADLLKLKWDIIVIDESHKIKSHNSKTSKLVYALSKKAEYVWGLSGTPRGNSDVDIYCQFHNMRISEWGDVSYTHFVDSCCDIEQKFFNGQMIKIPIGINKKYAAGWEKNVAMFTQRVDYDELDNMPELTVNLIELDYTPTKEYLQAEEGIISIAEYESTMTKLGAIIKAHQAVNGYLYIPRDDYDVTKRDIYWFSDNDKLKWIRNNLNKEPTVIVYRFEADVIKIRNTLDNMSYRHTENVADFKSGLADVLLLQCARCESFNLQMCRHIIFYTMDYSYIKYEQMLRRIYRMGQTENCKLTILTFKETIETKIWKTVKMKETFANLFMSAKGV